MQGFFMDRSGQKRIAAIALLAATLAVYLFLDFVASTGFFGAASAPARQAEAIVVLTGGKGRVEEGLRLFRNGSSRVLILSGVHEDADLDSIFRRSGKPGTDERGSIILEKASGSTYENAVEVDKITRRLGLKSVLLITSIYHMKRAHYTFRKILPPEVAIVPITVPSPNYDEYRWWGLRSLGLILPEFLKYYWYVLCFTLPIPSL